MKWNDVKRPECECPADKTQISNVMPTGLPRPPRGQKVRHYRADPPAYWWHWLHQSGKLRLDTLR